MELHKYRILRPGMMAVLIGALVAGLVAFSAYELRESRRIILASMEQGAISLLEAMARAGENALRADAEIEALTAERLLDNARLIRDMESKQVLSEVLLSDIARQNGLFRINVFDADGQRIVSSESRGRRAGHRMDAEGAELSPLLRGEADELLIGFKTARFATGFRFAAAVRRPTGGAIVVVMDAGRMAALRRAAGIERLLQEVGENPGIVYVLIQDADGAILASPKETDIAGMAGDGFLEMVLAGMGSRSRLIHMAGASVFEMGMPFVIDGQNRGVLRIGLAADAITAAELRTRRSLTMLGALVVLLCAAGLGLVMMRRNYVLLDAEKMDLEAGLRRSERLTAMGELAAGVAHEVRNPLNAIGLIAQRLEREFDPVPDGDEYRKLVGTVRGEVGRVNRIIQQFLNLARPPKLSLQAVVLPALLEKVAGLMEARASARGLRLVRDMEDVGTVRVDPEQIQQAVLNLLENAIAATETGEVRLLCREADDGWIEVGVWDTGTGIPPENMERIFDLYFTTKPEGTGLGLSLVQRIVSEHGGRIVVESEPGKGSLFWMRLPRRG